MKRIVWMLVIAAAIVSLATFWSTCQAQVVPFVVPPAGAAPPPDTSDTFDGTGDLSANWTFGIGATANLQRASDTCRVATNSVDVGVWWNAATFSANQWSQVTVKNLSTSVNGASVNLLLRADSTGSDFDAYFMVFYTGTIVLYRCIDGSFGTALNTTTSYTVAVGDVIKVAVSGVGAGVDFIVYINGTPGWEVSDSEAARIVTAGHPGVGGYTDNTSTYPSAFDSWSGGSN